MLHSNADEVPVYFNMPATYTINDVAEPLKIDPLE
jgi:hypothetical protein